MNFFVGTQHMFYTYCTKFYLYNYKNRPVRTIMYKCKSCAYLIAIQTVEPNRLFNLLLYLS